MASLMTPMDIVEQDFPRKVRGYDPADVRLYLKSVAEEVERLNLENGRMLEEIGQLKREMEGVRKSEKALQDTLIAAHKMAEELRERARAEADLTIREARLKAERLLDDGRAELAQLEADIRSAQTERVAFEVALRGVIDQHQSLLEVRRQTRDEPDNVRPLPRRTLSDAG